MIDVSIILAVYNGQPFLTDAVNSVLNQDGIVFELIAIDDGSTDGSSAWLDDLSAKDSRVMVTHNNISRGLTCCLNQALRMARGRYIARIDHDDLWLPEKLLQQVKAFSHDENLVLVGTAYREEDLAKKWQRPPILPVLKTDTEIREALYRFNPFFHSSVMFRRDVIDRIGGYNESYRYAQDYEMWTRILKCGKGQTIPNVLCVRRMGKTNISIHKERAQRFNALRAKLAWCSRNGLSWKVSLAIISDLLVIILPSKFKAFWRECMRKSHTK